MSQIEDVLKSLNQAVSDDQEAMDDLIETRVPCNDNLADHPHIQVAFCRSLDTNRVGALGLINGVLMAAGLPKVMAQYGTDNRLLGFCEWREGG